MTRHVVIDVETAQSYDHIVEIAAVEVLGNTISPRSLVRRIKPRSAMAAFLGRMAPVMGCGNAPEMIVAAEDPWGRS